jgi:hypothetical protein
LGQSDASGEGFGDRQRFDRSQSYRDPQRRVRNLGCDGRRRWWFASVTNFISPDSFPFFQSILFLLVVMVGGIDTVFGPLIGAVIIVLLPEALFTLGQYRLLFVGVLMLAVLRIAPTGFVGLFSRLSSKPRTTPLVAA